MSLRFIRESYLEDSVLSRRALLTHRYLLRGSLATVHIFAWLFAFQYFYLVEAHVGIAFVRVILLYALSQTITCLATPYTARYLRFGTRRMLIGAVCFAIVAFAILGATFDGVLADNIASYAIVGYAIMMGLYRALYWIPYEVQSEARNTKKSLRGELLIAFMPLFGGLFAVISGSPWLLYVGVIVIGLSVIPLRFVRNIRENFSWGYRETFQHLFATRSRPIVIGAILDGIVGAAMLFFWPFAIFFVVSGSYGVFGIILAFTLLITIFARKFIRRLLESLRIAQSRTLRVVFTVTPWILRLMVSTPLGIIFADSYFYTTSPRTMGIDTTAFEQSSDGGSYIDEYTALKEMGLALGRIAICLFAVAALWVMPLALALICVFLVAGSASTMRVFVGAR